MASDDISQLAETLSRTQIGDGELSYKDLGLKLDSAESVKDLVHEIRQYQGLRALCLEGNTIGVDAAKAIAEALESKDQLQRCYWSDMFTGRLRSEIPTVLLSLGSAIITAGARLTELDLSDNAFGPVGITAIKDILKSPTCFTLRKLRLNNCGIGVDGGKILAESLMECHRQSSAVGTPLKLRVFVAGRNRLENKGASALAKAFQLMGSLEEVHMPQNGINFVGVKELASALQHNPELRVLNFNDNTFTKKGTLAMAQALQHLNKVEVINFGDCLVRSEGAFVLAGVLREGLPVLKELNLSFGEITEAAALMVVQAVVMKSHMEKVDLNGNCLGAEGCDTLREAVEDMDKGDVLASLSDDEGAPDDDEDDDENEDDSDDANEDCKDENEEYDESMKENGITQKEGHLEKATNTAEIVTFLTCPSAEKLLQLGEMRANLQEQVDVSEPHKAADVLLKIFSLYCEHPEIKVAVLEATDALLKKLLSSSAFHSYCFLSTLLVRMGLLKGEEKMKKTLLLPVHLLCLEHGVQQEYFPQHHAALLHIFLSNSRDNEALESCSDAREKLTSALEKRCHEHQ